MAPGVGVTGVMQVEMLPAVTGTLPPGGSVQSYQASVAGQNVYLSFTATQGQNLELTFNNVFVPGAGYNQFIVYVNNAVGGQVASFWCYAANPAASCTQHLWYLAAGKYSVVAVPVYGGTLHFNALLQPDVVGPAVATGDTASVTWSTGQVERLTTLMTALLQIVAPVVFGAVVGGLEVKEAFGKVRELMDLPRIVPNQAWDVALAAAQANGAGFLILEIERRGNPPVLGRYGANSAVSRNGGYRDVFLEEIWQVADGSLVPSDAGGILVRGAEIQTVRFIHIPS